MRRLIFGCCTPTASMTTERRWKNYMKYVHWSHPGTKKYKFIFWNFAPFSDDLQWLNWDGRREKWCGWFSCVCFLHTPRLALYNLAPDFQLARTFIYLTMSSTSRLAFERWTTSDWAGCETDLAPVITFFIWNKSDLVLVITFFNLE